jgi:hypothetical protein
MQDAQLGGVTLEKPPETRDSFLQRPVSIGLLAMFVSALSYGAWQLHVEIQNAHDTLNALKVELVTQFGAVNTQVATVQGSINLLNYRLDHQSSQPPTTPAVATQAKP